MRRLSAFFSCLISGLTVLSAAPLIQPHDALAICGDSITEQKIYSVYIEDYLLMCQPTPGQSIVQLGWSGEQAPGFLARLDTDLYPFKPTVATTCYGMNDGHYGPLTPAIADTYRKTQTAIVESLKRHGVRAIVIGSSKCVDSFYYHHNPAEAVIYNQTLGSLADIDRDIAAREGVAYADVFAATTDAMAKSKEQYGENYTFGGGDGVHPGPNGHLVMAYAFLKALGCDGAIGTIKIDLGLQQARGTPGQKIISFQNNTVEVESTRYPFCFQGNPDQPTQDDGSILKCVPFNQDLNRYVLVVEGLTSPSAKVTWGSQTREFTADQLKAGINLAAEFLNNPFADRFNKVTEAVRIQQNSETFLVKELLHSVAAYKQALPQHIPEIDQFGKNGINLSRLLFQNAASLVIPVHHTIKIEAKP